MSNIHLPNTKFLLSAADDGFRINNHLVGDPRLSAGFHGMHPHWGKSLLIGEVEDLYDLAGLTDDECQRELASVCGYCTYGVIIRNDIFYYDLNFSWDPKHTVHICDLLTDFIYRAGWPTDVLEGVALLSFNLRTVYVEYRHG